MNNEDYDYYDEYDYPEDYDYNYDDYDYDYGYDDDMYDYSDDYDYDYDYDYDKDMYNDTNYDYDYDYDYDKDMYNYTDYDYDYMYNYTNGTSYNDSDYDYEYLMRMDFDSRVRDFAKILNYTMLRLNSSRGWEDFGYDFDFGMLKNTDMADLVFIMPDLFDLYFYDQYILGWWWYGAVTQGQFRTDEEDWWNEVEEYDYYLEEAGTYD